MNKFFLKPLIVLVAGMFLTNVTPIFGQISDTPTGKNISLDSKTLYEHGFNKDNLTAPPSDREIRDSVTVGAVMNYFVMPDKNYNAAYFAGGSYAATNLTTSQFNWTVGNGSAIAPQAANTTGTSPWVKVTWAAPLGATTVKVKEAPQGLSGTCDSQETTIDIEVIAKPTVAFTGKSGLFEDSDCYDETALGSGIAYDFDLTVSSQSSQLLVSYTVTKDGLAYPSLNGTNVPVTMAGGKIALNFTEYGAYEVTITEITDRIARKCDVVGDIGSENVFSYTIMPQPQTGPIYHIPNNF